MPLPSATPFSALRRRELALAVIAMGAVVLGSNILVLYPINDWLTWGAFSYPVAFLVSNVVNRRFGPQAARRVVWIGFALAVLASITLATPRIALGSCLAFLTAQLLDIGVFDRLRHGNWWRAPLVASTVSASVDTAIFWSVSFAGEPLPWVSWALGDLAVKLVIAIGLLVPFRVLIGRSVRG